MLKEYESYVYTNSFGIKRLPSHWNVKRAFSYMYENVEKNVGKPEKLLLQFKYGTIVPKKIQDVDKDESDKYEKYSIVHPGDIAINGLNLNYDFVSQRIASVDTKGIITSAYLTFTPRRLDEQKYLVYLFKGLDNIKLFHGLGTGLRQTLTSNEVLKLQLPVPPKAEQDQIVRYLDWKVSEMNHMIHGMKRQIKLLKEYRENIICQYTHKGLAKEREMNPSEFPWIEGVPEGWAETRLKYVLTKLSRERKPEHELLICSNKGKVFFRGDSKLGLVADDDSIYQGVKAGDLLIHGMDTWHGAIAISDYDGMCTGVVHVCDTKENKRFIMYYLQSLAFKKVYKKITNGVRENTSDFRSWDKAGQINLLLPPIEEQNEIARILDEKNDQIEQLIASLEQEIIFVEELKTKTIADVVTGQVDVRNVIIPEYTTDDDTDDDFDSNDIDDDSEESDEDEE